MAYVILVPQPGTKPAPSAVEACSLNHWTAREVPGKGFLDIKSINHIGKDWEVGNVYIKIKNVYSSKDTRKQWQDTDYENFRTHITDRINKNIIKATINVRKTNQSKVGKRYEQSIHRPERLTDQWTEQWCNVGDEY